MGQNRDELVVAPGADIFVAPVGLVIPEDPVAALEKAWIELGFITDDGAKFKRGVTIKEFMAAQRRTPVRRETETEEIPVNFTLEQWNAENFAFAFGGGEVVKVSAGIFKYEFPGGAEALAEKALIMRWADGDKHYQLGFPQGNVIEDVDVPLKRGELSGLPIGYKPLAGDDDDLGVTFVTDDPAFDPEGS